jgi:hypothetical protein
VLNLTGCSQSESFFGGFVRFLFGHGLAEPMSNGTQNRMQCVLWWGQKCSRNPGNIQGEKPIPQ